MCLPQAPLNLLLTVGGHKLYDKLVPLRSSSKDLG